MAPALGEQLGSYRLTSEIGRGGMGIVYLAEHAIMGRRAAVKVLLPQLSVDQEAVARFFDEARATAQLENPAFVEVFDCGTGPDGSAFIVMEYLRGVSLAAHLAKQERLPPSEVADLGRQIALAVGIAHRHGIVHRDLKPDNVMLTSNDGQRGIKILDFGIAKLTGGPVEGAHRTRTGLLLGTPLFMAPEQCRGAGTVDNRADIYAVGCMLYALACGHPPFVREGVGEIIAAQLYEAPSPLRAELPAFPEGLEAVILRALAKAPADRQQDMEQLADELAPFAATSPAETAPRASGTARVPTRDAGSFSAGGTRAMPTPTTLTRGAAGVSGVRAAKRRPLLLAAVGLSSLAALGWALWKGRGSEPPPVAQQPSRTTAPRPRPEPPQQASPDARPPEPRQVSVQLISEPAGATVIDVRTGARLGVTPLRLQRPQSEGSLFLRIERPGRVEQTVEIPLEADLTKTVQLPRKRAVTTDPDEARKL